MVPFAVGGPTDILGRLIGKKMAEGLGQAVFIDNKAGGGLGSDSVAKSSPDGYTLLLSTTGTHTITPNLYAKLPYDPVKDFAPVSLVVKYINILVVNPHMPVRTVSDLIALAKAKPGEVTFGSADNGSSNHLTGEMLATMTGTRMQHVPYKGSGPALNDVIAGQITFMFDQYSTVGPNIKAGKLRTLAIASRQRHPVLPEIAERMAVLGWDPVTNTPEQFSAQIKSELAVWSDVVKKSGAKVD
ncbi:MAG: tripartite tricarboxylate transporter substrate binding protein [Candidatus Protistobacter heckmanni]|nr:tripartite tricarboxylate transporter substrate binding protein [Candidatus Protistobacter heckmanni]